MIEQRTEDTASRDGQADFDFFMGTWNVHHQKLRERLRGSTSWEEFDSVCVARKILGGRGNMDEITMERPTGRVMGMTIRLYNPETRLWSIHWMDSVTGTVQAPMIGRFEQGRGEFYDREVFEDKCIISRFIWTVISENACRWEQAFSADGGKTWETNWIMDNTRRL
ncbi:MAG TPA: DUF1579 domain-containing protein [Ktedonobacterales bacterium]|nr:DUF1579 domain-containing protein [Ktedonobacterales bacterium]